MPTPVKQPDFSSISLSPKQRWSARKANKRLNFWHGSVRSGKTVGSQYRFAQFVGNAPRGELLLAGRTIDSLKRNIISPLIDLFGDEIRYYSGRRELQMWDRTVYTVGASDERSAGKIQGSTLAGVYGDEITLWPESFFKMALSRMSVPGAQMFGTMNPDNPNHWFKKQFLDRKAELDMASFFFKLDDNPYLPKAYVDSLKKEYTGLWYKRYIEGLWCVAEGAVYDFFDPARHCIKTPPMADFYDIGIDYGTTNPTCFLLFGFKKNPAPGQPKVWMEREYYYDPKEKKRQQTDSEFLVDFQNFVGPYKHKLLRNIYCDPSAESFQLELRRNAFSGIKSDPAILDADNAVLDGIRTVSRMMVSGEYKICECCPKAIDEKCSYSWDSKAANVGVDKPLKTNDHAMDPERYVIHSNFGTRQYDLTKFLD